MAATVKTLGDVVDQIMGIHQLQKDLPDDDVHGHHNWNVRINDQTIGVDYDGEMVLMKMITPISDLPRVYFPHLLSSTQHLLKKKRVELFINTCREYRIPSKKAGVYHLGAYYGDTGEFVDTELIRHEGIIGGSSEIEVGKNIFSLGYCVWDRGIYIVTLPNELKHNRIHNKIVKIWMTNAYLAKTCPSAYHWQFFLPKPLRNFDGFEVLTSEVAEILNAPGYYVASATVKIPIGKLSFLKLPPRFGVSSKGPYGPKSSIEYICTTPEEGGLESVGLNLPTIVG